MNPVAIIGLAGAALWLSWANGANDNFKGVATLLGSGTTSYERALWWGTATTLAGSACALFVSGQLAAAFSGKGVVPDSLVGSPAFLFAVGCGAAGVVTVATLTGMPVSTTHALVGGLGGAGAAMVGLSGISWSTFGSAFALPLLISPLLSALLVRALYPPLRHLGARAGIAEDTCFCVEGGSQGQPVAAGDSLSMLQGSDLVALAPQLRVDTVDACVAEGERSAPGVTARALIDGMHFVSAGAVSFARGLNDTPKIAALLLVGGAVDPLWGLAAVAVGMAAGALLHARRVAHTMSFEITRMTPGQGLTANAATAFMVLIASRFGVPVSTTHVSTGSLFGLGATTGQLRTKTFRTIVAAWIITLPCAFAAAWAVFRLVGS